MSVYSEQRLEKILGELLVELSVCSREEFEDCVNYRLDQLDQGIEQPLVEILRERGVMSRSDFDDEVRGPFIKAVLEDEAAIAEALKVAGANSERVNDALRKTSDARRKIDPFVSYFFDFLMQSGAVNESQVRDALDSLEGPMEAVMVMEDGSESPPAVDNPAFDQDFTPKNLEDYLKSDRFFQKIAIKRSVLSNSKLAELTESLKKLRASGIELRLEDLILQKQMISREDLAALKQEVRFQQARTEDELLLVIAVKTELVTRKDAEQWLQNQQRAYREYGSIIRVSTFIKEQRDELVEKKVLEATKDIREMQAARTVTTMPAVSFARQPLEVDPLDVEPVAPPVAKKSSDRLAASPPSKKAPSAKFEVAEDEDDALSDFDKELESADMDFLDISDSEIVTPEESEVVDVEVDDEQPDLDLNTSRPRANKRSGVMKRPHRAEVQPARDEDDEAQESEIFEPTVAEKDEFDEIFEDDLDDLFKEDNAKSSKLFEKGDEVKVRPLDKQDMDEIFDFATEDDSVMLEIEDDEAGGARPTKYVAPDGTHLASSFRLAAYDENQQTEQAPRPRDEKTRSDSLSRVPSERRRPPPPTPEPERRRSSKRNPVREDREDAGRTKKLKSKASSSSSRSRAADESVDDDLFVDEPAVKKTQSVNRKSPLKNLNLGSGRKKKVGAASKPPSEEQDDLDELEATFVDEAPFVIDDDDLFE
ncbi:MAG: hypothetical protein NUW37_17175 [Planctomycetes bacterium]|nr:hypothetical protein [Planctomycetota bacterium]